MDAQADQSLLGTQDILLVLLCSDLFVFSDYLEHSSNHLKYGNSMNDSNSQKTLTESSWC